MHKLVKVPPLVCDFALTQYQLLSIIVISEIRQVSTSRNVMGYICDYVSIVIHAQAAVQHIARVNDKTRDLDPSGSGESWVWRGPLHHADKPPEQSTAGGPFWEICSGDGTFSCYKCDGCACFHEPQLR